MRNSRKNLVAVIIITIIVTIVCEWYDLGMLIFPILFAAITFWFIISPFKLFDDAA